MWPIHGGGPSTFLAVELLILSRTRAPHHCSPVLPGGTQGTCQWVRKYLRTLPGALFPSAAPTQPAPGVGANKTGWGGKRPGRNRCKSLTERGGRECEGSLIEDSLSGSQGSLAALFFFNQGILLQVADQN